MLNYKASRKKKMLVISNSSLSHAVFYAFKDKFHRLSNRLFVVCKFFHFDQPKMHNVERVKLQNIANSKFFLPEKILLCRSKIRLHLLCLFWLSAFSRLSTIFSVTFFFTVVKILDRVVKDNFYQKYFKDFAFLFQQYSCCSTCYLQVFLSMLTLHIEFITRVTCFNCLRFLLCPSKIIDSYFVPIPTLPKNNSGIEPHQVGIFTSLSKVRILTLHRTIPELSRFLLCAEHIYAITR